MRELITELSREKMTINQLYSTYEAGIAMPITGGALGALILSSIAASKIWYCSMNEEYFYYFKVNNTFSYKGIKKETIHKIKLSDITKIVWKSQTGYGYFEIMSKSEKITGSLRGAYEIKDNFVDMLRYIQRHYKVECVGYYNKAIVI